MPSSPVKQSVAVAAMLMMCAHELAAQSCLGLADLSAIKRNVSAYGSGAGSDRLVLARLGGAREHAFGGVQVGYGGQGFDKPKKVAVGADFGFALPLGSSNTTICPMAQSVFQLAEERFGVRQKQLTSFAGVALGHAFNFSPSFSLVPFVQAGLLHRYSSLGAGVSYAASYPASKYSLTGGEIGGGFGLRFGNRLTVRPALTFPVGFPGGISGQSEPTYSITASFGLRR